MLTERRQVLRAYAGVGALLGEVVGGFAGSQGHDEVRFFSLYSLNDTCEVLCADVDAEGDGFDPGFAE